MWGGTNAIPVGSQPLDPAFRPRLLKVVEMLGLNVVRDVLRAVVDLVAVGGRLIRWPPQMLILLCE